MKIAVLLLAFMLSVLLLVSVSSLANDAETAIKFNYTVPSGNGTIYNNNTYINQTGSNQTLAQVLTTGNQGNHQNIVGVDNLKDYDNLPSVDVQNRELYDDTGSGSVDWLNRILLNDHNDASIDWSNYHFVQMNNNLFGNNFLSYGWDTIQAKQVLGDNLCYSNGVNCTTSSGNPFNQSLNTTDNVSFNGVNIKSYIVLKNNSLPPLPLSGNVTIFAQETNFSNDTRPAYVDDDGQVIVIGRDLFLIAKNIQGSTILRGQAVQLVAGSDPTVPEVTIATATSLNTTRVLGIAMNNVTTGSYGYFMSQGLLFNVNTTGLNAGYSLYLSPFQSGYYTTTKPSYPNLVSKLGTVLYSGDNGTIYVAVDGFTGGLESGTTSLNYTFSGNATALGGLFAPNICYSNGTNCTGGADTNDVYNNQSNNFTGIQNMTSVYNTLPTVDAGTISGSWNDDQGNCDNSWDGDQDVTIRVQSYRLINGNKVYSSSYSDYTLTGDGTCSGGGASIGFTWTPILQADGYRVLVSSSQYGYSFDHGEEVTTNAWNSGDGSTIPSLGLGTPTSINVTSYIGTQYNGYPTFILANDSNLFAKAFYTNAGKLSPAFGNTGNLQYIDSNGNLASSNNISTDGISLFVQNTSISNSEINFQSPFINNQTFRIGYMSGAFQNVLNVIGSSNNLTPFVDSWGGGNKQGDTAISSSNDILLGITINKIREKINVTGVFFQNQTKVLITNASSWSGYAMCYTTGGELGHCTSIVGVTGQCTCAQN